MATFAFIDGHVTVNAVDVSQWVRKVTISTEGESLENTAMGSGGSRGFQGGLKTWSFELEWNQDFEPGGPDATIWPLLNTVTAVTARAKSDTVSPTNPEYGGNVLVTEYSPLDGSVGDLGTFSTSWQGSGALNRTTA